MEYGYVRRTVNPYGVRRQPAYRRPRCRYAVLNFNGTMWACRRGGTHWTPYFQQATQFKSQEEAMEAVRVLPGSRIVVVPPHMWKTR